MFNFELKMASEKRLLQLSELDELRLEGYMSSKIYKERTKQWHHKNIMKQWLDKGDMLLLFNSKLWLFLDKLRSRCSGPFKVSTVFPNGVIEV